MKRFRYLGIWMILSIVLTVVCIYAFNDEVIIFGWSPKKAPLAKLLDSPDEIISNELATNMDSVPVLDKVVKTDSLPQSIFIFGDSMTYNLALRLAQYAKQNGHTIHSVNWDSSNTKIWADHDTLAYYINKYRPTHIFISLGSNEMYFKNPETRLPYIQRILETIDTIPYVWIGPPNWKEDTGINDLLARTCKAGSFFRSEGMDFKRKKDNIHPTRESSALWVDSIMRWLPKSNHPFVAEIPADSIIKSNPNIRFIKALNK